MISNKQLNILRALGTYTYLSRLQMARIGLENYSSAFSKYCSLLLDGKYIGLIDASTYGLGHIYYLKKKGAKFIALHDRVKMEQINFCLNKPQLSNQTIYHRTGAINCQIELIKSLETHNINLIFYDREIERLGNIVRDNNLIRKTRVPIESNQFLEPDAIFQIEEKKNKKLFCLEYEHKDNTKKSFEKVLKHLKALNLKSPSKKYDHPKAHRTLFVYHNPVTMNSVLDKIRNQISGVEKWFLFKSYDEVCSSGGFKRGKYEPRDTQDFLSNWSNVEGEKISCIS